MIPPHHELSPLVDFFEDSGGILAILTFVHFIADFLHQGSTFKDLKSRWGIVKHSFMYAIQFIPIMLFLQLTWTEVVVGFFWLWISHHVIDSHYFTKRWVLNLYRPYDLFSFKGRPTAGTLETAYHKWRGTPDGRVVFFVIDQIQHGIALWPIVIMTLY